MKKKIFSWEMDSYFEPPGPDLEPEEPKIPKDVWFKRACEEIPRIIREFKVVTERELKIRLEGEPFPGPPGPFPWVTGYALTHLLQEGVLKVHGYAGRIRVGKGVPERFFSLRETPYKEIEKLIEQKRRISADVNSKLTGEAPASIHAEEIFREAFENLEFKILGRDVSELNGEKVVGINGKKPPDLDFVIERDGIKYGTDIKNWLKYEKNTRNEVDLKISAAKQLKTVPFIVPRYIDREWTNKVIYEEKGIVCEYKQLLFPSTLRSLAEDANRYLGYPILATDTPPRDLIDKIEDIHRRYLSAKK